MAHHFQSCVTCNISRDFWGDASRPSGFDLRGNAVRLDRGAVAIDKLLGVIPDDQRQRPGDSIEEIAAEMTARADDVVVPGDHRVWLAAARA